MPKQTPTPEPKSGVQPAEALPSEAERRDYNIRQEHNIKKEGLGPNTRR